MLFYAYRGENTSIGEPNKQTGLYSTYGDIIAFTTRAKRDRYVSEYSDSGNPSVYAKACTKHDTRGYCLGSTVRGFNDHLEYIGSIADEHYNSYFQIDEEY